MAACPGSASSRIMKIADSKPARAELYKETGKGSEARWIKVEGSTTDVVGLERKIEWTLEVPVPPEPECSGRG